jgi:hypothetical protein
MRNLKKFTVKCNISKPVLFINNRELMHTFYISKRSYEYVNVITEILVARSYKNIFVFARVNISRIVSSPSIDPNGRKWSYRFNDFMIQLITNDMIVISSIESMKRWDHKSMIYTGKDVEPHILICLYKMILINREYNRALIEVDRIDKI